MQCLAKRARYSIEAQEGPGSIPDYIKEFKTVFAKEDFDVLLEYCCWDHAIELLFGSEPKLSKMYPLSPVEQKELDAFLKENLHTGQI